MKYGRFVSWYDDISLDKQSNVVANIGDNAQAYAIDHLYRMLGIPKEDIIDLNYTGLKNYDGEYVIVPMAQAITNYKRYDIFPISRKVIPFYISTAMNEPECEDILSEMRMYQPIGCRDEETMELLRKKGVQAYLSGCVTLTLPKRKENPNQKKIYLVDTPPALENYIPIEWEGRIVRKTHAYDYEKLPVDEEEVRRINNIAIEQYKEYCEEAALVVSSRLHAIVPCLAMGIPVIAVSQNFDYRFSWLDKFIPLYYPSDFNSINWNPQVVDVSVFQQKFIKAFQSGLERLSNTYKDLTDLSSYLEDRHKEKMNRELRKKVMELQKKHGSQNGFTYGIWGCGVHGKLVYKLMQEICPQSTIQAFIDPYVKGRCMNVPVFSPGHDVFQKCDYIWVTTQPGREMAKEALIEDGKQEGIDFDYFISASF